jgi:hypothetical protein
MPLGPESLALHAPLCKSPGAHMFTFSIHREPRIGASEARKDRALDMPGRRELKAPGSRFRAADAPHRSLAKHDYR